MISKGYLRYTDSNFYKKLVFKFEPWRHRVTFEDINDPGRVTFKYGLPFASWPLILKFNAIVDPFEDLVTGIVLLIPTLKELKRVGLETT